MAITSPAAGTEAAAASGGITLNAPGSPATNDIWIAVIHSSDNVAHTLTDWTQIQQGNGGGTTSRLSVWYFRYAGSNPNLTVGHTAGSEIIGGIRAFRGCHTSGSPVDVSSTVAGGTDATMESTGVTVTTTGNALLICGGAADDNNITALGGDYVDAFEDSGGGTQRAFHDTAGTPDGLVFMQYDLSVSSGGTGTVTVTQAASDPWSICQVVLKQDLTQALTPSLYTNADTTFYTHLITLYLTPGLVTNTSTFNAHDVGWLLTPSLFTNTSTVYDHTVTLGEAPDLTPTGEFFTTIGSPIGGVIIYEAVGSEQPLEPDLYTNSSTFYTHVITTTVGLTPSLFTNSSTFNTHVVTPGAVDLAPSLFTNTNSFNTHVITTLNTLVPSLFTNDSTFNTHVITTGAVTLTPSLYTNTNTFNTHAITVGAVDLAPSLFTNSSTFNTHTLTSTYALTPSLFTNTNSFNTHVITVGAVDLTPSLYTNSNTFNTHVITSLYTLAPSLYTNDNTFYTHTITTLNTLVPSLYTNDNTFYTHVITTSEGFIAPSLYTNTSTFYTHVITTGAVALTPSLFTNSSTFYTHTIATSQPLFPSLFTNQNSMDHPVLHETEFFTTVGSPIGGVMYSYTTDFDHTLTRHTPDRRFAVIYM